jgi:hypothetical protein
MGTRPDPGYLVRSTSLKFKVKGADASGWAHVRQSYVAVLLP